MKLLKPIEATRDDPLEQTASTNSLPYHHVSQKSNVTHTHPEEELKEEYRPSGQPSFGF